MADPKTPKKTSRKTPKGSAANDKPTPTEREMGENEFLAPPDDPMFSGGLTISFGHGWKRSPKTSPTGTPTGPFDTQIEAEAKRAKEQEDEARGRKAMWDLIGPSVDAALEEAIARREQKKQK
mgnify:CR=1 FL=1